AIGSDRQAAIVSRLEDVSNVEAALNVRVAGVSLAEKIRRGDDVEKFLPASLPGTAGSDAILEAIEDARYAPYLARQRVEVERVRAEADTDLANIQHYRNIGGLSMEMVERLEAARPENLASAARIRGITPAALAAILIAAQRRAA
ncbi:MAG TPA: tRNA uridine-5-carboxymethylaminomethyl(34) synthesis enzyme MnmG, partial [Sphingomonas sp.]|nr:tRNA uridine-5-carboxymethylaminomethyl(34) synthesis enzyme MnmG [Sphingomonas sp.]